MRPNGGRPLARAFSPLTLRWTETWGYSPQRAKAARRGRRFAPGQDRARLQRAERCLVVGQFGNRAFPQGPRSSGFKGRNGAAEQAGAKSWQCPESVPQRLRPDCKCGVYGTDKSVPFLKAGFSAQPTKPRPFKTVKLSRAFFKRS